MRVWPGKPHPLGAEWDGQGTNFSLFSRHATRVELCLPDAEPGARRVELTECTDGAWHAYLPDVRPGDRYGYRVHGPFEPGAGHRFNAHKLLVDPCARALAGPLRWHDALFDQQGDGPGDADGGAAPDTRDTAERVPLGVVVDPSFPWGDDRRPDTPWSRTVIYECHVRGLTIEHPEVPVEHRGRFLGLAAQPVIRHLQQLGVTAVELLPVQHSATERFLARAGRTNYWGYNPLAFSAPDARFASGDRGEQVREFKGMVRALHRAGIEVILDVVYNHTAEGGGAGPTLSLRGIDNAVYYRLDPEDPRRYLDTSGCGNGLRTGHPQALALLMDSLRYWAREMRVDGFRFDLAPALARDFLDAGLFETFFGVLRQDPELAGLKLIAEPWDLGPDGYRLGGFPAGWSEWNGEFRDTCRRFWRGDEGQLADFASRLAGSSDIFSGGGRGPSASVNFVTCHDGFTLNDLVSYEHKHNEANGESNRDGHDANWSRNWGFEGPTDSVSVRRRRERAKRNLMATIALSQGVPMLSHGDELGRTQLGNNNAYCQDNALTWVDWKPDEERRELLEFVRHMFALRQRHPLLRRRHFFSGEPLPGLRGKDLCWLRAEGGEMRAEDWNDPGRRTVGMLIEGRASDAADEAGQPERDATLLLLVSNARRTVEFLLPELGPGRWRPLLDTARPGRRTVPSERVRVSSLSLLLLERGPGA